MTYQFSILAALMCTVPAVAQGASPIMPTDVPSMVGKHVYPTVTRKFFKGDDWVYAGERLTLVSAEPWGDQSNAVRYNYVRVRTEDGKTGEIQWQQLSGKPLAYNLRKPGTPRKLVVAVFNDGYAAGLALHRLREKHDYDVPSDSLDYAVGEALREAFDYSKKLCHNLIYGTNRSTEDVMRRDESKWTAMANDDAILEWYAKGIPDKNLKSKLSDAKSGLSNIDNLASHGFGIARLRRQLKEKEWLEGTEGLPPNKVKKLDKEKTSSLKAEIGTKEKRLADALAKAKKMKRAVR